MSSKTKILVLKLKEIIYTSIFVILGLILIILLILIITGKSKKKSEATNAVYSPGVYTSSVNLSGHPLNVAVEVDSNNIKSITLQNQNDAITTMYPLIDDSFSDIATQIVKNNSTENVVFNLENKYTTIMLINAVNEALNKASIPY